jgi:hypothetical protein
MLRTAKLFHPASIPAFRPKPGVSLPGTLASPRTGLAPAGRRELVARLRHDRSFAVMAPELLDARILGIQVTEESPYAVVMDAAGTMLRLTQVDGLRPQPFTVAAWRVPDMGESIDALAARGVTFIRYEGMDQDAKGIWSTPGGDQVAWFKDPDGNTLSLTWFAE